MDKIKNKMSKKLIKEEINTNDIGSNNPDKFKFTRNKTDIQFNLMESEIKDKTFNHTKDIRKNLNQITEECVDFTQLDLMPFRGKKVLIETLEGNWYGTLGVIKNNFALLEEETVKKVIEPTEVIKVLCENTRILILEKNKPNDPEKWSSCKRQAKAKFDVYPSAYANAWAAKCYKKKGGSWRSVKEDLDVEINSLDEKTQNKDLILCDRLKTIFFNNNISEEIVNKDNKGKLTKDRQSSRDKIEKKLKNVKVVKGPPGRMDTPEEARYRLATYIELNKGKGKSKSKNK
jgi:hypothetical protein